MTVRRGVCNIPICQTYFTVADWRDVPLLSALSLGVGSVEADVSLINGTLFVTTRIPLSGWLVLNVEL